jgi:hypothetical protein
MTFVRSVQAYAGGDEMRSGVECPATSHGGDPRLNTHIEQIRVQHEGSGDQWPSPSSVMCMTLSVS